jgi:hypothetical protein
MASSDSEYSSDVLVRNLKSCEEVIKKQGGKKKTGGAKTGGLVKSAPRKSRMQDMTRKMRKMMTMTWIAAQKRQE